ncbi:MAG: S8 family peptidase [Planctomycetota bacterium]|jgi:hypothetical protein
MSKDKHLPIKIVESARKDFRAPQLGGGPRKIFGVFNQYVRNRLIRQLSHVKNYFKPWFEEERASGIPGVARVILKKDAIAKSHRPSGLFKKDTCPIIGGGALRELYISITPSGLTYLAEKIERDNSKSGEANISTISKIEPFSIENALLGPSLGFAQKELEKKDNELKIRLFIHDTPEKNEILKSRFNNLVSALRLPEPEEMKYSSKMKVFKLRGVKAKHLVNLAGFIGTQSFRTPHHFSIVEPAFLNIKKADPREFSSPGQKSKYPIIGIIDTGTNPADKIISPWIISRHNYVVPNFSRYEHGSFVAGLMLYGSVLNDIRFGGFPVKIIDVAAVPDPKKDKLGEDDLLAILEEVIPKHPDVKWWNLSLSINEPVGEEFTDLGIMLDEIQDKYNVRFVLPVGNFGTLPLPGWPRDGFKGQNKLSSPADCVRGTSVGSIAHQDNPNSCVKINQPSAFTRRGPGAAFLTKPELVHYGGNCRSNGDYQQLGVLSLDGNGNVVEHVGTSYSTPLITAVLANIDASIKGYANSSLVRALAIHSAFLDYPDLTVSELRYKGFGIPNDLGSIISCKPWEATLIFEPELRLGLEFIKHPFPIPQCLFKKKNKVVGEILMTLAYDPPLEASAGAEYCRINVDASLGTYKQLKNGKPYEHKLQIKPQPKNEDLKAWFEQYQIKHGFKWSPLKVYGRKMKRGVGGKNWDLRLNMIARDGYKPTKPQKVAVIVTMRSFDESDNVYNETVRLLNQIGWRTSNLRIEERIRAKI